MSCNLDYVGPKPVIDLHAAGLKTGEIAARLKGKNESSNLIYKKLLKNNLVQLFNDKRDKK